jgi:Bacteriophage holin of superfamily 6 (Holin_LLH)
MSWSDVQPFVVAALPLIVPILLAWLSAGLIKLNAKLPAKQKSFLAGLVGTAVAAVEQKSPAAGLSPAEKKAMAMSYIHSMLTHFGLSVPDSVIEPLLEESVFVLDLAQGKTVTTKAGAN